MLIITSAWGGGRKNLWVKKSLIRTLCSFSAAFCWEGGKCLVVVSLVTRSHEVSFRRVNPGHVTPAAYLREYFHFSTMTCVYIEPVYDEGRAGTSDNKIAHFAQDDMKIKARRWTKCSPG